MSAIMSALAGVGRFHYVDLDPDFRDSIDQLHGTKCGQVLLLDTDTGVAYTAECCGGTHSLVDEVIEMAAAGDLP